LPFLKLKTNYFEIDAENNF